MGRDVLGVVRPLERPFGINPMLRQPQTRKKRTVEIFFLKLILVLLLFNSVVIPNSFQISNAALMVSLALLVVLRYGLLMSQRTLILTLLSYLVTTFYVLIGSTNGAPDVALIQVFVIYIVSPILWIIISDWIFHEFEMASIFNLLGWLTVCACLTVAIFFYLVSNFGSAAVVIFNTMGNIQVDDGYSAATMHVFGSLIFLGAAFYSAPSVIQNLPLRYMVLLTLPLTAIASGRSAFVVALAIGGLCFVLTDKLSELPLKMLAGLCAAIVILFITVWAMQFLLGVDVLAILQGHFDKILLSGGEERILQSSSLIDGIIKNSFLGMGHGVGVEHVRSDEMPWRYEAVLLATVFRVGIFGSLIYALPFILAIYIFFKRIRLQTVTNIDRFFGSGLIASLVSANTNPYIEGFALQWMYFLPLTYFLTKNSILKLKNFNFYNRLKK